MKGQQVIMCPQCGDNKVKGTGFAFKGMIWMGLFLCITIIGIPIGIILILAAFIMKYSKTRLRFMCQECKHDFRVTPETYDKYKEALRNNEQMIKSPTQ